MWYALVLLGLYRLIYWTDVNGFCTGKPHIKKIRTGGSMSNVSNGQHDVNTSNLEARIHAVEQACITCKYQLLVHVATLLSYL